LILLTYLPFEQKRPEIFIQSSPFSSFLFFKIVEMRYMCISLLIRRSKSPLPLPNALGGLESVCNAISCDVDQNKSPRDEPWAYEEEKRTQCVIKNAEFPSHSENSYFSLALISRGGGGREAMIE
jgi:hypothetical protein